MNPPFDLSQATVNAIRRILRVHPSVKKAILFGSRAMNRSTARSDVDIALVGNIDWQEWAAIRQEIDDLPYIQKFDVVHLDRLEHEELRAHIERVGKVLYDRTSA